MCVFQHHQATDSTLTLPRDSIRSNRLRAQSDKTAPLLNSRCKLLSIEWINNKVLLHSTRNYIQYPVINHNGKEYEKECVCVYN